MVLQRSRGRLVPPEDMPDDMTTPSRRVPDEDLPDELKPSAYQKISTALNLPGYGRSVKNILNMPYNVAVRPFVETYKAATSPTEVKYKPLGQELKEFGAGLAEPYIHPKTSFQEDPINTALAYIPAYEALSASTRAVGMGTKAAGVSKLTKAAKADIPEIFPKGLETPSTKGQLSSQTPYADLPKTVKGLSSRDMFTSEIPNEIIRKSIETNTPIFPDMAGENIYQLVNTAKNANKEARYRLKNKATETLEKQSTELQKIVNKNLGSKSKLQNLDEIETKYKAEAQPAYEEAMSHGDVPEMAEFVKDETFKSYIAKARRSAVGRELKDLPDTDIRVLDAAKKKLDDAIGSAIKSGEKNEARALQGLKKELTDGVDGIVPKYAEARSIASERFKLEEAQDMAKKVVDSENPESIGRLMETMDDAQKEAFIVGLRDKLTNQIGKGAFTGKGRANIAEKMFGVDIPGNIVRDNLRATLGDEVYGKLMSEIDPLVRSGYNSSRLLGGSNTVENLAGLAQSPIASGLSQTRLMGKAWKGLLGGVDKFNYRQYDPISKMVTDPSFLREQMSKPKTGIPSLMDLRLSLPKFKKK